jgi:hypothetical protein
MYIKNIDGKKEQSKASIWPIAIMGLLIFLLILDCAAMSWYDHSTKVITISDKFINDRLYVVISGDNEYNVPNAVVYLKLKINSTYEVIIGQNIAYKMIDIHYAPMFIDSVNKELR